MEYLTVDNALIGLGLIIGIAAHIVKKVIQQRENGDKGYGIKQFFRDNPYKTFMTFFYGGAGLMGLYVIGDVSIYTAILTGFSANSLSGASDK